MKLSLGGKDFSRVKDLDKIHLKTTDMKHKKKMKPAPSNAIQLLNPENNELMEATDVILNWFNEHPPENDQLDRYYKATQETNTHLYEGMTDVFVKAWAEFIYKHCHALEIFDNPYRIWFTDVWDINRYMDRRAYDIELGLDQIYQVFSALNHTLEKEMGGNCSIEIPVWAWEYWHRQWEIDLGPKGPGHAQAFNTVGMLTPTVSDPVFKAGDMVLFDLRYLDEIMRAKILNHVDDVSDKFMHLAKARVLAVDPTFTGNPWMERYEVEFFDIGREFTLPALALKFDIDGGGYLDD